MPRILYSLKDFPVELRGGAVAIGNFDGVHRGHASLVSSLTAQARRISAPSIVFTFDPPPIGLLYPERVLAAPLTSIERRGGIAS